MFCAILKDQVFSYLVLWWRWGELPAFFAGERDARIGTLYRAKNQGIHQCEHWFMHSPPGCADMVQLPNNKTETAHPDG